MNTKALLIIFLTTTLYGCAGSLDRVRPQAIQPQDTDLTSINDNLGFLVVNIKQHKTKLKLRNFSAKNLDTGELYSFPFFDNVILGSQLLQHTVVGDNIEHMLFLDLPAGTYEITRIEFFQFQFGYGTGNTSSYLNYKLFNPINFQILSGAPTNLGQLNIKIQSPRIASDSDNFYKQMLNEPSIGNEPSLVNSNALTGAYLMTMAGTIEQLKGLLFFSTPAHEDIHIVKAKGRYPAIKEQHFQKGKIWISK